MLCLEVVRCGFVDVFVDVVVNVVFSSVVFLLASKVGDFQDGFTYIDTYIDRYRYIDT